ncbi:MAG: DUF3727 domain-containing protein, partial [Cyanobacteria bacterium J06632_3]
DPSMLDEPAEYPVVTLTDEDGRKLACYVEKSIDVDGAEFLLLLPVNLPIEIFVWEADDEADDDEEAEILVDVEEDAIDELFPSARAVLAELDLLLERSAHTLTAVGDLPEADEEDCFSLDVSDEDAEHPVTEEFQMLATFFHEDAQYTLCTPLDPLLFFATRDSDGAIELVDPEDFQAMRSQLEDKLFDVLD